MLSSGASVAEHTREPTRPHYLAWSYTAPRAGDGPAPVVPPISIRDRTSAISNFRSWRRNASRSGFVGCDLKIIAFCVFWDFHQFRVAASAMKRNFSFKQCCDAWSQECLFLNETIVACFFSRHAELSCICKKLNSNAQKIPRRLKPQGLGGLSSRLNVSTLSYE